MRTAVHQYLSKFTRTYSKFVSLCQSCSAPSELISNCLSLSVRTEQSVSLCQTLSVMSIQYQYLSKFVSENRESQYFFGLAVLVIVPSLKCQIAESPRQITYYPPPTQTAPLHPRFLLKVRMFLWNAYWYCFREVDFICFYLYV